MSPRAVATAAHFQRERVFSRGKITTTPRHLASKVDHQKRSCHCSRPREKPRFRFEQFRSPRHASSEHHLNTRAQTPGSLARTGEFSAHRRVGEDTLAERVLPWNSARGAARRLTMKDFSMCGTTASPATSELVMREQLQGSRDRRSRLQRSRDRMATHEAGHGCKRGLTSDMNERIHLRLVLNRWPDIAPTDISSNDPA